MQKFLIAITLVLVFWADIQAQDQRSALFLGNSYTAYNNLPAMVANLASSLGDTLIVDSYTPGGKRLSGHATDANSISKITGGQWDYVILQDQSQIPALGDQYYFSDMYPGGSTLDSIATATDSCTQTLFYMTWGRKNGDSQNCGFIPEMCTYEGMQARLRAQYLRIADTLEASVAPVGAVWREIIADSVPGLNLYTADESHPSLAGSYVAACTFYASIFHRSPVGSSYTAGLAPGTATYIQEMTEAIVFDSLTTWLIDTTSAEAGFTLTTDSMGNVTVQNTSANALVSYNFGDGTISTDTNATHNYAATDTMVSVSQIVYKQCSFDTLTQNIQVRFAIADTSTDTSTYIPDVATAEINIYPNPACNMVHLNSSTAIDRIELFNLSGVKVLSNTTANSIDVSTIPAGIYQLVVTGAARQVNIQKLVILK